MVYLFKKTVFNCHQATLLSLKKDEGRITLAERARLSYHLLFCDVCQRFIRQSHEIDLIGKGLKKNSLHELRPEKQRQIQQEIDGLKL